MKNKMKINALLETDPELTVRTEQSGPVVLSTRLRLARNLSNHRFPGWAKKSQRREVWSVCKGAIESLELMSGGTTLVVDDLSDLEKQILMERRMISRELMESESGGAVCISRDQSCVIMINEEDHLRIQLLRPGLNFKEMWRTIDGVDDGIEERLDYAFDRNLGYLTACPTNVGTGLRASAMLHLPALVIENHMEKVVRAVNHLGLAVRGLFGEGSEAYGSIFQISNQQTLGESEEEILSGLTNVLNSIIEQENNARLKMLQTKPEKVCDKIGRAYGILRNAHILSSTETMKLLSLLRLAVDLGALDEAERSEIDRFYIEGQPGHIQFLANNLIDPRERDLYRARILREHFSHLPLLNFDNLANYS